jgi:capsular exopolysaccharide synthesis family protein
MLAEPHSGAAERFRILRTNFEFFNVELGARSVMVTSAVSTEGKSTTIANLAVALAQAGQRIVLVDLDLRRPIQHRFFADAGPVLEIADGRALLRPVAFGQSHSPVAGANGSLEIVMFKTHPNHAADLVRSDQLAEILDELRSRADMLLVDAPPLLLAADAMQLTAQVDAVLVVTRLNVLRRQTLDELAAALDHCPAAKLGFVVTGAELEGSYRSAYDAYYPYARSGGAGR